MLILLKSEQLDLFSRVIPVRGSVRKDGVYTRPHTQRHKVKAEPAAPVMVLVASASPELATAAPAPESHEARRERLAKLPRKEFEAELWSAMNARWDAGGMVSYGTSLKRVIVAAKDRSHFRMSQAGHIQCVLGKKNGQPNWYDVGPIGQPYDSLTGMMGFPNSLDRRHAQFDEAKWEAEQAAEAIREKQEDERRTIGRIADAIGVPEDQGITGLTQDNLRQGIDWADQSWRGELEAFVRERRPDLFEPHT